MTRDDLGNAWPLTVSSGTLSCDSSGVVFTSGGNHYAINGTARTSHPDYPPIQDIWAKQPGGFGTYKNLGPLIDRGLALCN